MDLLPVSARHLRLPEACRGIDQASECRSSDSWVSDSERSRSYSFTVSRSGLTTTSRFRISILSPLKMSDVHPWIPTIAGIPIPRAMTRTCPAGSSSSVTRPTTLWKLMSAESERDTVLATRMLPGGIFSNGFLEAPSFTTKALPFANPLTPVPLFSIERRLSVVTAMAGS